MVIHKIIALFLTFVLLANSLNNLVIVTDFVINQDFIAKTLCIQKADQKGCNGKCHLTKQLAQKNVDSNSEKPLPSTNRTQLDVFIISTISIHSIKNSYQVLNIKNTINCSLKQPVSGFYSINTPPPNLS